eukprot:GHVS01027354.1.p1 GENE.GHVS01027354.1~~GHVS01027354.1.p1  ORF type:complete len:519 (-),score=31.89 GHVS01027354.1:946-2502(-)
MAAIPASADFFASASSYNVPDPNKIAVDILLSQPAYFSGQVFRCNIQVKAPKTLSHLVGLDYVTIQLYGVVSSSVPDTIDALKQAKAMHSTQSPGVMSADAIDRSLGPESKLLVVSDPCIVCSDLLFAADSDAYWYGYECILPSFLPPSFSGNSVKYVYNILLVVQKRLYPGTVDTTSATPIRIRMPIQLLGPRSPETPLLQGLGRAVLPDPNSGKKMKGRKHAAFGPVADLRAQDLSCRGPAESIPKVSVGLRCLPAIKLAPDSLFEEPDNMAFGEFLRCNQMNNATFDFQSHSWQGGSCFSQISLLRGLPTGKSMVKNFSEVDPLGVRSFGDSSDIALNKTLSSFFMEEDDDEIAMPHREKFRISQGDEEVCVLELLTRQQKDGSCCYCSVGSCVPVNLDFGTATAETLEVHIAVVRNETAKDVSRHKPEPDSNIHEQIVWEHHECVLNQWSSGAQIFVPSNVCPSFETDLVNVSYSLVFRFYRLPPAKSKTNREDSARIRVIITGTILTSVQLCL